MHTPFKPLARVYFRTQRLDEDAIAWGRTNQLANLLAGWLDIPTNTLGRFSASPGTARLSNV